MFMMGISLAEGLREQLQQEEEGWGETAVWMNEWIKGWRGWMQGEVDRDALIISLLKHCRLVVYQTNQSAAAQTIFDWSHTLQIQKWFKCKTFMQKWKPIQQQLEMQIQKRWNMEINRKK